jgi:putative membrane protein
MAGARVALAGLGAGALALAWLTGLPALARHAFSAHMAMHMAVVAVAAPLLAAAVAGTRWDPTRRAPALFAPIPASFVELLVVWAWHAPALHHAARHSPAAHAAEQGTFLASGLLLWLAALGGPRGDAGRRASGVVALLLTSMHMTLLGALLALTPRPLYHRAPVSALSPLDDQHLGGAIMLLVGGLVYLAGGLALTRDLLRPPRFGTGERARARARQMERA